MPFEFGIIRNHYVGRTFIQPTQSIREVGVRMKHSANRGIIEGKRHRADRRFDRARHDLSEDRQDDARGREQPRCISASPRRRSLIRITTASTRPIAINCWRPAWISRRCGKYIGADTLAFLSVDGVYRSMGYAKRDNVRPQFTDHCFTGEYPTRLTDVDGVADMRQLGLLAEAG